MTLLIGIIRDNQCVISGDYRRTNIHNTEEFYDNIIKVDKLNRNILVGYAGDLHLLPMLARFLTDKVKENTTLDGAARSIKSWAKKYTKQSDHLTTLLVGRADDGKPAIISISHRERYRINKRTYKNGENINWEFVYANVCPDIESKLGTLRETVEDVENLCRILNFEVSKVDTWVSEKCEVVSTEL